MRLAPVVRAVAKQRLPGILGNAAAEQLTCDLPDVHVRDFAIVRVDIHRGRGHGCASPCSRNDRNVLRRSTWHLLAQLSMPQRSPRMITASLARVTAV